VKRNVRNVFNVLYHQDYIGNFNCV